MSLLTDLPRRWLAIELAAGILALCLGSLALVLEIAERVPILAPLGICMGPESWLAYIGMRLPLELWTGRTS